MSTDSRSTPLQPMLVLLLSLIAAWLLWSGLYKTLLLSLGALSCFLCFWVARRMNYFDEELFAVHFSVRLLRYWLWLGGEIILSSLTATRIVLDPKLPITPRVVDVKSESSQHFEQVTLANSITLTPGTLSIDLHKGVIKVHSLTEDGARDLAAGDMNRRVANIRGK